MDAMHDEMAAAPDQLIPTTRQLAISHPHHRVQVHVGDRARDPPTSSSAVADARPRPRPPALDDGVAVRHEQQQQTTASSSYLALSRRPQCPAGANGFLSDLPNELLLHILGYLDVNDLLSTSRVGFSPLLPLPPPHDIRILPVRRAFDLDLLAPLPVFQIVPMFASSPPWPTYLTELLVVPVCRRRVSCCP